jgi:AraC-like DNA-binding protein
MVAAAAPLIFTTRGVPGRPRLRALHMLREQGLLPVEPLPGSAPGVELVKWWLPGASVLWGHFDGVRQVGDPESGRGAEDLFFGINLTGAGLARQRGREITIGAGDAMAAGMFEGAFTVLRPAPSRMIGVRVPRRSVPVDTARGADTAIRLVPGQNAALQLLTRYLRSLLAGPVPSSPPLADAVVTHVTELIALSLGSAELDGLPALDPQARAAGSVRAARTCAIKADIDRHLTDPSLAAEAVARRHGITTRYLHKLFEDEPQTYSKFVLDRRLDLVHRKLGNPRDAARSISSIAHDAGFGDLSYFNRTFRRRYGLTPSEARHRLSPTAEADGRSDTAAWPLTGPPRPPTR